MRNLLKVILVISGLCLFGNASLAQRPDENLSSAEQERRIAQQEASAKAHQERALSQVNQTKRDVALTSPSTYKRKKAQEPGGDEDMPTEYVMKHGMLPVPSEYYQRYAGFLKNKKTTLARLYIDKGCDKGKTVTVQELERCAAVVPVKGGGSFYSFRYGMNSLDIRDWWDIHFVNDVFAVGNGTVQSIIVELGDIDLRDAAKSKALKYLRKYDMKDRLAEIKEQNTALKKGINQNGFIYSNIAPVKLDQTYAVRSVAYLYKERPLSVYNYTGVDITVVFKVVGQEKDGSLILLWKELGLELPRRVLK